MVILYAFIKEEHHQELLNRYLNTFSEKFKGDILKYRRWQDAQLSLLGRVLLQYGLKYYYGIHDFEIGILPNNKPFLKGQNVYFNISHSKNLAICVIADFPVGIDVEFLDENINYLDFKPQMTYNEFNKIHYSESKVKSLFSYWTKKEAVLKAHGEGLMIPLESFEISDDECLIGDEKFYLTDVFIDENYYSCVASNNINVKKNDILFRYLDSKGLFDK